MRLLKLHCKKLLQYSVIQQLLGKLGAMQGRQERALSHCLGLATGETNFILFFLQKRLSPQSLLSSLASMIIAHERGELVRIRSSDTSNYNLDLHHPQVTDLQCLDQGILALSAHWNRLRHWKHECCLVIIWTF
jgi:hypothetical protein